MRHTVVVALGGNALTRETEAGEATQIESNAATMATGISGLLDQGWRVIVVHGNGPQVGNLAIQQEEGAGLVPSQPLHALTAMTQGQLGSVIARAIDAIRGPGTSACLVTHVLVDPDDPAFERPSKPIGPFFESARAEALGRTRGWVMQPDSGRGHRRRVASPRPLGVLETDAIACLLASEHVVLAAGGGGIPVKALPNGGFEAIDAVIDKGLAAERVANGVDASAMLLITGVPAVSLDFGTPRQRVVAEMSADEAQRYLDDGQFPPGSMGPKVSAALDFVSGSGGTAVITSADKMVDALDPTKRIGTRIVGSYAMSPA